MELADLAERVAEYGSLALVITVGDDSRPHVVSANVRMAGDRVEAEVGRTTTANAGANPDVSIVWAALDGGDYCLIVDGRASVGGGGAVEVRPTRAVLHRLASATGDGPSCVTVLDQRG